MVLALVIDASVPALSGIMWGTALWVLCMLILLYHQAGMQVLGALLVFMGILLMLSDIPLILAFTLLLFGFFMHGCGRLLMYLRRRE